MRLDGPDLKALALWAAECAGRVLPFFEEERPENDRPRRSVEAGTARAHGEITVGEARAAAIAAHSAAREADLAAATAHMAAHAPHAGDYAARAGAFAGASGASDAAGVGERDRWYRHPRGTSGR